MKRESRPPKAAPIRGEERLHKRIAASGMCSRRAAEEMIRQGRVEVNGEIVTEMGVKVSDSDEIRVDGMPVGVSKLYYLVMNKPAGYVTTLRDPQGRPTVTKFLPRLDATVKPVGRLDMDTEGLLIFTNDGEFANLLAHPRHGVEKEYLATVEGVPNEEALEKLRKGVYIQDGERGGKTAPARVSVTYADEKSWKATLKLVIHEGRKRQVRLMCEAVGHPVLSLKRVRIGPLQVRGMAKGECRMLGVQEVEALRNAAGKR